MHYSNHELPKDIRQDYWKKEPIKLINIPIKYRKGSMNNGINSQYF